MRDRRQKTRSRRDEIRNRKYPEFHTPDSGGRNEKGIALVMALMISLVVMLIIVGTLYLITQSTSMSGAGKRYATASEAADGAVEVMKDAVNLMMVGEDVASLPLVDGTPPCLLDAVLTENQICTTTMTLPGTVSGFTATVVLERLYSSTLPGGRLEFARGGGAPTTGIYYRINTVVAGAGGTRAETTALYRFTM
jgi:Tfp pilus assembly protein PilX